MTTAFEMCLAQTGPQQAEMLKVWTAREELAAQFMAAILSALTKGNLVGMSRQGYTDYCSPRWVAKAALHAADALIAESEKPK